MILLKTFLKPQKEHQNWLRLIMEKILRINFFYSFPEKNILQGGVAMHQKEQCLLNV